MQKVILHWGEMGTRWGVNRSVAQIHALLFLLEKPLTADELTDTLKIARSNVSTSLKELQGWGLVRLVHVLGDRKDHFEALGEPWDMFMIIVEERRKREIEPTLSVLREAVAMEKDDKDTPMEIKQRITEMLAFIEEVNGWYADIRRLPSATLRTLMRMGAKIARFIPSGRKSKDNTDI